MSEYTIPARDRHPRERRDASVASIASVASMASIASGETGRERGGKGERCAQPRDILLVSFVYLVCSVCGGRFGLSGLVNRLWANEARAELRHSPDNDE